MLFFSLVGMLLFVQPLKTDRGAVLLLLTKVNRITGASMMNLENVIFLFPGDLMESWNPE